MVVLNETSRFHLAIEALRRAAQRPEGASLLIEECRAALREHHAYVREHFEDMPSIRNFRWHGR